MSSNPPGLRVDLFYSYSHMDVQHKNDMQKTLAALKRGGFLRDWSDAQITPGQRISETLQAKLPESDIVAFLLSPEFSELRGSVSRSGTAPRTWRPAGASCSVYR